MLLSAAEASLPPPPPTAAMLPLLLPALTPLPLSAEGLPPGDMAVLPAWPASALSRGLWLPAVLTEPRCCGGDGGSGLLLLLPPPLPLLLLEEP
jgi:hypothetical protein